MVNRMGNLIFRIEQAALLPKSSYNDRKKASKEQLCCHHSGVNSGVDPSVVSQAHGGQKRQNIQQAGFPDGHPL
jgi:hypothetical protein